MFFKSVVFLTVIYVCCDLFECTNIERYDVHRILLKARNKGRYKKNPSLRSAYTPYQKQFKQPYLSRYRQYREPHKINENDLSNLSHIHSNKYKAHNRFKKHKHSHNKPARLLRDTRDYMHNLKYNLYNDPKNKFLNPNLKEAKQQESNQAHTWNTLNEPLSEEETGNYNVWESPESNEFKGNLSTSSILWLC
ncbi:hypothetical protein QE152_g37499 [Popillia japonica]|uniref:Uncharacterized protein n=1 Tax=Popillia japonica TaxID=7064 RepID=A0AAW1IAL9_POPJA